MSLRASVVIASEAKQSSETNEIAAGPSGLRNDFLLFILITALCLTSCVSNYNIKARAAHEAYHRGNYEDALILIDKVHPSAKDELLFLMDKGMILHSAGKFNESNKVLTEAEEISEAFAGKYAGQEAAAALWSEEAGQYGGEKYERLLIPVIRMLNYIMMDQWEEALVEVRRLNLNAEKILGGQKELNNAFSIYLSAIVWETLGYINDALIAYSRLKYHEKDVPYYGHDITAARAPLGLSNPLPAKDKIAWEKSKDYRKQKGELIVIAEAGRSPEFESEAVSTGLITLTMPALRAYPAYFKSAKILIDGKEAGKTYTFYNIMDDITSALKDRQKRSLIRKMIKMPVQTALYAASIELMNSEDTESQIAGAGLAILALSMAMTEKADERSWRTLPAEMQIGRFYVPPGRHEAEIIPEGTTNTLKRTFEIRAGTPSVWLVKYPQSGHASKIIQVPAEEKPRMLEISSVTRLIINGGYEKALNEKTLTAFQREGLLYIQDKGPKPELTEPGKEKNEDNALSYFILGAIYEHDKKYEEAAWNYMQAYKYGLPGRKVEQKIIDTYGKTNEDFRKSKKGLDIAFEFAGLYLSLNPQ
jgi:hypothetical protein